MKSKKILLILCVCLVTCGLLSWLGWEVYDANADRSGWQEKDGIILYRDFHGDPVTGWLALDGARYYFAGDHARTTGWLEYGGERYYFGPDGSMRTGWQEIDDIQYCFDSSGCLYTGWQALDGNLYFFGFDGHLHTGWLDAGGSRYYLNEEGILQTGWQELGEDRYYFGPNGKMLTSWQEIGGSRYFFGDDGAMATGWLEYEGRTLYLSSQGNPLSGWQTLDGSTYCFDGDGFLLTGWLEQDGQRYYFGTDGAMVTGWLEQGEYRYYLQEDGTAAVGPTVIDGRTYHFTPKGIYVLLVNPWSPVPEDYVPDLVEIEEGYLVDSSCYEALQRMMADCRAAGLNPSFSSTYRTWADQVDIIDSYIELYQAQGYSYEEAVDLTNQIAAQPGTSEHHLGLAMDIVGGASTPAVHAWLHEHCWEYGFILRYLEGKQSITGFIPESWHFRYVGTEVSMDMKDTGLCLEEYLGVE